MAKAKYSVGQKVTVRSDLEHWGDYGGLTFVGSGGAYMSAFLGKEVTIDTLETTMFGVEYQIKEDDNAEGFRWYWTEEMFVADEE